MESKLKRYKRLTHEYRPLLLMASAALVAELAYAVLNLSGGPIYMLKELNRFYAWGFIFGTFLGVEALARPAMGVLGDRIGRKPLLLAGPAITAITSYATILYTGPYVVPYLIFLRILDGLGSAAMWMNAFAAVGDIVGEKHRSAAMSVLNVTYMAGMALGFLLGGAANEIMGTLKASFYLASVLFIISFFILLFLFPKEEKAHEHADASEHEPPMDFHVSHIWRSFKEVPDMIVMAVVTFVGMGMLTPIVKVYAVDHLGLTEMQFGKVVAPIALVMGALAVPLGHLGDRYGKTTAVCWGLLISAVAMWALALYKILWVIGIAGAVIGVGFTVAFPAWNALVVSQTDPKRRGEVLGAVGLAQGVAALAGTLLGPIIYESDALSFPRLGVVNYNVPFWISAIAISAGSVICFTWVCGKRVVSGTEERVTCRQSRNVQALAILGVIALVGWIGWRYTLPVRPDRVAWSWVQQVAREKPTKALKYSVPAASGWNATETIKQAAPKYHDWVYTKRAGYSVGVPTYLNEGTAEVRVKFLFPADNPEPIYQTITLCRNSTREEWKVCGLR